MEIRQLKTLVSIIDFGGFAAAGDALGLTQSAISLQIKALESEFGEDLFDRSKRPPIPTVRAIDLARKSREILRLCNDLNTSSGNQYVGSLQLGAVPSVQRLLLPKGLQSLRSKYPELFINLHSGLSEELTRSVYRGLLDAAIVSEPQKIPTGMSWYPFASESLVVISHKKAIGNTAKEILESNPNVRFKRSSIAGELISHELKQLGINVDTVLETDNFDSIWQIVASGLGVSIMPQHIPDSALTKQSSEERVSSKLHQREGNPHDKLIPRNVNVVPLSKTSVKLVTGLVRRTSSPKSDLIDVLLESLKG